MSQRCLIIADDLTGGADAGAQFARRGFNTLLLLSRESKADLSRYPNRDVLVVSTHSRGAPPEEAARKISFLLEGYPKNLFTIVYKKIDSTLRGNIGYETDAVLKKTGLSSGFLTPAFPEQGRIVVGGIHLVRGRPLALTEFAGDGVSPVRESHVKNLIERQSRCRIGHIDLTQVASGGETLTKATEEAQQRGIQLLIFDAATRQDLAHIVEAAFERKNIPLFIGSAGLAEEVAKRLVSNRKRSRSLKLMARNPLKHILVVSGSASGVSHEQLNCVVNETGIPSFEIGPSFLAGSLKRRRSLEKGCAQGIGEALGRGAAILKMTRKRIDPIDSEDPPVHVRITQALGRIAYCALEQSRLDIRNVALILFGGDTSLGVLNHLKAEGIEIEGELLRGIGMGRLVGGEWHGLRLVTKAGGFGKRDALIQIFRALEWKKEIGFRREERSA